MPSATRSMQHRRLPQRAPQLRRASKACVGADAFVRCASEARVWPHGTISVLRALSGSASCIPDTSRQAEASNARRILMPQDPYNPLRQHLVELLVGGHAHAKFRDAIEG